MAVWSEILQSLGEGVVAADAQGRFLFWNPAAERLVGLGPAPSPPRDWSDHYGLRLPDRVTAFPVDRLPLVRAMAGEATGEVEMYVHNPRVEGVWLAATGWPLRDANGATVGGVVVLRDITSERERWARLERERALVDMVAAVGAAANAATSLPVALKAAIATVCERVGFAAGHAWLCAEGRLRSAGAWHVVAGPADPALFDDTRGPDFDPADGLLGRALQQRDVLWIEDARREPSLLNHEALTRAGLGVAVLVPVLSGQEAVGVLEFFGAGARPRDEAEAQALLQVGAQAGRTAERERARRREAFVQAVVDHVADPIFVKDRDFRFVYLSRALCEMVGRTREEMIGKTDYDFFPRDQADYFRKRDQELFATGSRVVIEEEPITTASGELRWLATTKAPLSFDRAGEATHLVGVIHDITRLKRAEAELKRVNGELAEEVRQSRATLAKLDRANRELEAFTSTVSHDLRAPLRTIAAYAGLLEEDVGAELPEGARARLQRVRKGAERMNDLVEALLGLSRVGRAPIAWERVDLEAEARAIVAELRQADASRRVEVEIEPGLQVEGDRALLRAVLDNLIRNAWKFTAQRDPGHIRIGTLPLCGERVFIVHDDGAGFDPSAADRIFEPFVRLHDAREFPGTGIGLSTVQRAIERMGGRVWAQGRVGEGATFLFWLPGHPPRGDGDAGTG